MNSLKEYPEVKFIDFPAFLDSYIEYINEIPLEQLEEDFRRFKSYYLDFNQDTVRTELLITKINERYNRSSGTEN
jgi:hypothetical protein